MSGSMARTIRFIGLFWQFESFVISLNEASSGPRTGATELTKHSPVMNPHNVIPDLTYPVKVLIRDYLPEFFQRRVIVMPGKASSIVDQDDVPCHRVGQNAIKFPPDRGVLSP